MSATDSTSEASRGAPTLIPVRSHDLLAASVDNDKLTALTIRWKAARANKQRELLILKTQIETMELLIGELEDKIDEQPNPNRK